MLQDMFRVESKHTDDGQTASVSVESLHDLCFNNVITSDATGAVFTAEIVQYQPGILDICF